MSSVPLLIAGDFNIHVDVPGNADSVCLKELLESMGLQELFNVPTHESGHTLDLIITRQCDSLLADIPVTDCLFSDHSTLICDLTWTGHRSRRKKSLSGRQRWLTLTCYAMNSLQLRFVQTALML